VTCSNCAGSRDGLHDAAPCPSCGSTAKTVQVSSFDDVVGVTESLGITALNEKQRPWQEKWQEVGAAYEALSEVHSDSAPGGSEQWKAIALTFFRACHELRDAVASDDTIRSPRRTGKPHCHLSVIEQDLQELAITVKTSPTT
jgi:hypothetical protein